MTNNRLRSLDVFRGLTITMMIIVNSPGNQMPFSWLDHSNWNGCTLADLVFPFFIFILGLSLAITGSKQKALGKTSLAQITGILWRTGYLFVLGLILNAISLRFGWSNLRIMGVLQRIAICYCIGSFLYLFTSMRVQFLILVSILIAYWIALIKIPVPGYGAGQLTVDANLAAWVDQQLIPAPHRFLGGFDPEGIFTTLPAIASVIMGILFAAAFKDVNRFKENLGFIGLIGLVTALSGWVWGLYFPINKSLWTSSYVLWTGGLAMMILSLCYWIIEIKGYTRWSLPFEIFGANALIAFVLHVVFLKIQAMIHLESASGEPINLRYLLTEYLFSFFSPPLAAFFYALFYTLLWFLVICLIRKYKYHSSSYKLET